MSTSAIYQHVSALKLVTLGEVSTIERSASLWSEVTDRFYRFLEDLPEHHPDVDLDVFKRVPVPV